MFLNVRAIFGLDKFVCKFCANVDNQNYWQNSINHTKMINSLLYEGKKMLWSDKYYICSLTTENFVQTKQKVCTFSRFYSKVPHSMLKFCSKIVSFGRSKKNKIKEYIEHWSLFGVCWCYDWYVLKYNIHYTHYIHTLQVIGLYHNNYQ